MAVTGKTAAPHEIPYFEPLDKPPNMATVTKAMADQTAARLDAIAPKQIVGATKKQLLIANASGVVTAVTASGDVTNDESGVFSIGIAKILEAMLADGAVTSRKLKPTLGTVHASESLTLTEFYVDVPGSQREITPVVPSLLVVLMAATMSQKESGTANCVLNVDEADQTDLAQINNNNAGAITVSTFTPYLLSLSAAKHTIKMRARRTGGAGSVVGTAPNGRSGYLYALFAS